MFSNFIYGSWKKIQHQKYKDLFPRVESYLKNDFTVLDFGIGKAWLETFLKEKDFVFQKVVGFDIEEKAIEPRVFGIKYVISDELQIKEKFDLVIAFDSLHTTQYPLNITKYAKENGLILISEPENFVSVLDKFNSFERLAFGEIGEIEKDYFILIKNK